MKMMRPIKEYDEDQYSDKEISDKGDKLSLK